MKKVINFTVLAVLLLSNIGFSSSILSESKHIFRIEKDSSQGCSIEATAAVYEENRHYGGVSLKEAREAWYWYYYACMEVGDDNFERPVFL
jgi:hypothetical protein